jgi:SAM-dependent methyltransferase
MDTYEPIASGYARYRRPDARIARAIRAAMGDAHFLVNVGAGAGSYEPSDMFVVAVDPSSAMLSQRSRTCALRAEAEHLPLKDSSFDVSLAVLTVHHWRGVEEGLRQMARVARRRVVILTWDPGHPGFWLTRDYFPEILECDRRLFPRIADLETLLGGSRSEVVPIPATCSDGFLGAYWRRPWAYLDSEARRAISTFARITQADVGLAKLRRDLEDGTWLAQNEGLANLEELDLGYRLLVWEP